MEFCGSSVCEIAPPPVLGELRRLTFAEDRFEILHGVIVRGRGKWRWSFVVIRFAR